MTGLLVLVGDHAFRAPRSSVAPVTRLANNLNHRNPPLGEGVVIEDLSLAAGTQEVARSAISRLSHRGPVYSMYQRALLVISASVGDLRSDGVAPQAWRENVTAIVRMGRALGFDVALLHVGFGDATANKAARRWSRRLAPELLAMLESESLIDCVSISAEGWKEPLEPGDAGVAAIAAAVESMWRKAPNHKDDDDFRTPAERARSLELPDRGPRVIIRPNSKP